MNIREGVKRIYLVLSVLMVAFALFVCIAREPSGKEWVTHQQIQRLESLYTESVANNPHLALPVEPVQKPLNTENDPYAEAWEEIRAKYKKSTIWHDHRSVRDIATFKRIAALPTSEIEGACASSSFFVPGANIACRDMADAFGQRDKRVRMYWTWVVLGPLLTALALYGLWRLFSWIFAGFSAKKQNQ